MKIVALWIAIALLLCGCSTQAQLAVTQPEAVTAQTTQATEPEETTQPAQTTEPEETTQPAQTTEPEETTQPAQTAEPEETTQPAQTTEPEQTEENNRQMAPDFNVWDSEGTLRRLSGFRGKPVVLNFWASWCGPCKAEMPAFDAAYAKYGDQLHFMMISTDDEQQNARDYITQCGFRFPVYYDPNFVAAYAYNVVAIPCTVFIDAEGYLVEIKVGSMNAATLEQYLQMLLQP